MIGITGKEYLLDAVLEYCEDIVTVKDLNLKYLAYNKALLKFIMKEVFPMVYCFCILMQEIST